MYHLQFTRSDKPCLFHTSVTALFASSYLLIEEGVGKCLGLHLYHVHDNTFGDFELLQDLSESVMRCFLLQMLRY